MLLIKLVYQVVAFLLEIGMLIILGMWGFIDRTSTAQKYMLGIGLPLLVTCLWGVLAAPRSAYRLELPFRLIFSLILFGLSVFLLYRLGHFKLALLFAGLTMLCTGLELFFDRH